MLFTNVIKTHYVLKCTKSNQTVTLQVYTHCFLLVLSPFSILTLNDFDIHVHSRSKALIYI